MKQTKILHTQEVLIMGSIAQRTETVKMCNRLYKRTRKKCLNDFIPKHHLPLQSPLVKLTSWFSN